MNRKITILLIFIVLGASTLFIYQLFDSRLHEFYVFRIVEKYPHDHTAFTQGLVFFNGVFYEGIGRYGESEIRVVEIKTGEILNSKRLSPEFFGEGVTVFGDKVYQITWRENKGFIYNLNLELLSYFQIQGEGWGLTEDGTHIIMSNGSSTLCFLDPLNFKLLKKIQVSYDGNPVSKLNELEYINGVIYGNIWQSDNIVIIDPSNGKVISWINLAGLSDHLDYQYGIDVLNGIAYDEENDRLFVTGKLWPNLFEIELIPANALN